MALAKTPAGDCAHGLLRPWAQRERRLEGSDLVTGCRGAPPALAWKVAWAELAAAGCRSWERQGLPAVQALFLEACFSAQVPWTPPGAPPGTLVDLV